jgi:predicted NACHT family NTPase
MFVVGDHGCPVNSLAFSPLGTSLAAAGKDGTARLWDLGGGPPVVLAGHTDSVLSVAFRPDGGQVATGSFDRTARLWDVDGRELLRLPESGEHEAPVSAVAFLNGGRMLISAAGNRINAAEFGGVRLWESAAPFRKLGEPHGTWALAATPHGKTLAWGGGGKRVTLWEITRQDRQTYPPLKTGVLAIALSVDGRTLAATDDWSIRLWDTASKQEQTSLVGHKGRVSSLAFSPDGQTLASGSWDKRVSLWDVATGRPRQTFEWAVGSVRTVAFSPDGLLAAAAGDSGRVVVWDVE